jgi:hypothetical protein
VLIPAVILAFQAQITLPPAVGAQLDQSCPGWKLAAVLPEVEAEIKTRTPSWPPNLIPGDFNSDNQTDAAVLIDCKGMVQPIAFVSSGSGFSRHVLEAPQPLDPRQFLHLIRGDFERDAIGVEFVAIGGHAWVYRNGRWEKVAY